MWFWREIGWVFFINGLYGIRILTRVYIASKSPNPLFLSFNNTDRTRFLYHPSQNPSTTDTFSSKKSTSNTDFTSSLQVRLCSIITDCHRYIIYHIFTLKTLNLSLNKLSIRYVFFSILTGCNLKFL
ncbi:hypothetical protein Hanom_Chr07g00614681 [Helianthus anomalus]